MSLRRQLPQSLQVQLDHRNVERMIARRLAIARTQIISRSTPASPPAELAAVGDAKPVIKQDAAGSDAKET